MPDPTQQVAPTTAREQTLIDENRRLRKVCAALIERVESSGLAEGAPYAAFEHAVLLAEQVRERTETLHRTLDELGQVNAQLREEIHSRASAEQRLIEAKQEAEAANLSKTKFLAAVSHDLLQPLNAARLFASALGEHHVPNSSRRLVKHIGRSLEDVETLLGTLVDISRLDAGVLKPDVAPFGAADLLDTLAQEYHQVAVSQGLTLHYVRSGAVIDSDLQLLARVVRNFLTNAIRYTARGHVLLGCRRRAEGLEICVGDTGPGIPEDQREAIFLEFRRAESRRDDKDRGLGLGLAIVDRITSMLDHPVGLASRHGRGSLFSVLVPYGRLPEGKRVQAVTEAMPGNEPLSGRVIWVIDNDLAIREGMQALLGSWGCRVMAAAGPGVLDSETTSPPDALVVDYHLEEGDPDGLEAASRLRERWPGLPVLVITANHDATLKRRARMLGFGWLLKPVKPLRLKMQLLSLLERT
ncbi:Signal transduction histidine kinase [Modicisalibacter muralis]|uniref:histidine kinase n=1 Tax=Modicisalibacter muralis TaxID=119000 RepID=A0A1G9FP25_9GAMM|nr:hybrid sensor histidine kinase/response regulator [Halomonas muralis]SDK90130.1 Signal transduction histidine kinase [Halomonas muralis]